MLQVFQGYIDSALSTVGDTINAGVMQFLTFVLGFFPDGDPAINSAIESWRFTTGETTFNVLYFVDISAVILFVGLAVAIPFVVMAIQGASGTVGLVNSVLEKIPFRIGGRLG